MSADIDHTSFAVHNALDWAARLRRELGATPIGGESLPEFRYVLLHVGDAEHGARLELLEPNGHSFLNRFLEEHGEGPHHITFTVPDLRTTVTAVRSMGLRVVGEDLTHAARREAFIAPDEIHNVVIQLAQTERAFPSPAALLASRERPAHLFPSNRGATAPDWWTEVWDTEPVTHAVLGSTHMGTASLEVSKRLFGEVLGGRCSTLPDGARFSWPRSSLVVRSNQPPGVSSVSATGGPTEGIDIGNTPVGGRTHA